MLIWDTLKILILVAAFCNPSSMYIAAQQLQTLTLNLVDDVRTKNRSVLSVFPQLLLVTGRLIVVTMLIVVNCVLLETIGHTGKMVMATGEAFRDVQQIARPLPTESLNTVVEAEKEKVDIPVANGSCSKREVIDVTIEQSSPSTTVRESSIDEDTASDSEATLENISDHITVTDDDHPDEQPMPKQTTLDNSESKNGNSDPVLFSNVDAHDAKEAKIQVIPSTVQEINVQKPDKLNKNATKEQPDVNIVPQIDGRQQSNNQLKRQSLLLPELIPPRQSIEKPRRKFSIVHGSNEGADFKPKRFLSIFKKKVLETLTFV